MIRDQLTKLEKRPDWLAPSYGLMIRISFMISVLWWLWFLDDLWWFVPMISIMIQDLCHTYPKWFALIPGFCDPRDPRLHVSPLRYDLLSSPVFGGPFPEEGVCVQDTQGQVPGRSGGDRSDQPTVTQGFMKKQGYPPSWVFFFGPHELQISLPEIYHSSPTKSRPT